MKRVFSTGEMLAIAELRGLLEQEGIETTVLHENAASIFSGMLPSEVPELWVVRDEDEPRARQVVEAYQAPTAAAPTAQNWTCPTCGEQLEGQFTECWKCAGGAAERE